MPQSARRTTRSTKASKSYRSIDAVHDNLARDLTRHELEEQLERSGRMDFDEQYRRRKESEADRRSRQRRSFRATVRKAQPLPLAAVVGGTAIAAMAILVVNCQVKINAISDGIVDMKQQIEQLEVEQISLQTKYEQAFDLAAVKESAEALGMQQPGDGQIIYIDLPGEDQARSYRDEGDGVLTHIFTALGQHIFTMMEYFR